MELSIDEKIVVLKSRLERIRLYCEFEKISQSVEYCSRRETLIDGYEDEISNIKNQLRSVIIENFIEN